VKKRPAKDEQLPPVAKGRSIVVHEGKQAKIAAEKTALEAELRDVRAELDRLTLQSMQPVQDLLVIVINLNRRPERLQAMHALLDPLGISWQRLPAVDGADLSDEQLAQLCTPAALAAMQEAEAKGWPTIDTTSSTRSFDPRLTRAAVGCALSHRAALEMLQQSGKPEVLILEDDLTDLADNFLSRLAIIRQQLASKGTYVDCYLGAHEMPELVSPRDRATLRGQSVQAGEPFSGTFARLVRASAVPELVAAMFPLREQFDVQICNHQWGNGTRYVVAKALALSPSSQRGQSDVQSFGADGHRGMPLHVQRRLMRGPRQRRACAQVPPAVGGSVEEADVNAGAVLLQLSAPPERRQTRSGVPLSQQMARAALARQECAQRTELATWKGKKRSFYQNRINGAQELRFSELPPFGVIAPAAAATRLGDSLRVARSVLVGRELQTVDAELTAQPRSLAWGDSTDPEMARSKRKYFDMAEDAKMVACSGADGVARRADLDADLADATAREICTPALAERVATHLEFPMVDSPLRAIQVNYQHTNLPQHSDESDGDGFGRDIATINVREHADVAICEVDEDGAVTASWWFSLAPGDVWAMPGDGACRGYVRWACTHGVPLVREPGCECEQGCTECRMSVNFRWGY